MVADSDLPYFRGYSRQRGRGFGALAQTNWEDSYSILEEICCPSSKKSWC